MAKIVWVALCCALVLTARVGADEPVRVGVCNVGKVLDEMDQRKEIQAALARDGERFRADAARRQQEAKDLRNQRDQLRPGTGAWNDKNDELMHRAIESEVAGRMAELEMARREKSAMVGLYQKIQQGCKAVARERKLDLVIARREAALPENLEGLTPDQVRGLLSQDMVLFSDEKVDITQDVTLWINRDFAKAHP